MSQIRQQVVELLQRRPDIEVYNLYPYTRLNTSTCSMFMAGQRCTPRIEAEFSRVLAQVANGDILRPDRGDAITICEVESGTPVRQVRRARDFYLTETVRRSIQMLKYCSENAVMGVLTGEYGIGKTEAIQHWREKEGKKVSHLMFEFDEFSSRNVIDFVGVLADVMDIQHGRTVRSGGATMRAICAQLAKSPMFLIFDQCEACSARIFQVIRQIHDATKHAGVGVLLLGSSLLAQKLQNTGKMKDIGAFTSRVSIWAPLRGVLKEEAAHIVEREGISNIEPAAFELLWKATGGSMRRLMAVTDLLVNKHAGKPVTVRTIEGVASQLWGMHLAAGKALIDVGGAL